MWWAGEKSTAYYSIPFLRSRSKMAACSLLEREEIMTLNFFVRFLMRMRMEPFR